MSNYTDSPTKVKPYSLDKDGYINEAELSASQPASKAYSVDKDGYFNEAEIFPSKQNEGTAGDLWTSTKKGVLGIPGMITGVADIAPALAFNATPFSDTANYLGKATGFRPGEWAKNLDAQYSQGHRQAQENIGTAWDKPDTSSWTPEQRAIRDSMNTPTDGVSGVIDKAKILLSNPGYAAKRTAEIGSEYIQNPAYVANQVVESLPSMAAGGVASKALMGVGAVAKPLIPFIAADGSALMTKGAGLLERKLGLEGAAAVAGGAGEGLVQAGQAMEQSEGADKRKNAIAALGSGVIDAVISAGGGKLAQHIGLETPETLMAKGFARAVREEAALGPAALRAAGKVAGGAVSEGLLQELPQSAQEAIFQNYADDKPLFDGVPRQAIEGMLSGFIMGGAANISTQGFRKGADPYTGEDTGQSHDPIVQDIERAFGMRDMGKPSLVSAPTEDARLAEDWANQSLDAQRYNQGRNELGGTPAGRASLMGTQMAGVSDQADPSGIDYALNVTLPQTVSAQDTAQNVPGQILAPPIKTPNMELISSTLQAIKQADANTLEDMASKMPAFIKDNPEYGQFSNAFRSEFNARRQALSGNNAQQVISSITNKEPLTDGQRELPINQGQPARVAEEATGIAGPVQQPAQPDIERSAAVGADTAARPQSGNPGQLEPITAGAAGQQGSAQPGRAGVESRSVKRMQEAIVSANDSGMIPYSTIKRDMGEGRYQLEAYGLDGKLLSTSKTYGGPNSIGGKLGRRKGRYYEVTNASYDFSKDEPFSVSSLNDKMRSFDDATDAELSSISSQEDLRQPEKPQPIDVNEAPISAPQADLPRTDETQPIYQQAKQHIEETGDTTVGGLMKALDVDIDTADKLLEQYKGESSKAEPVSPSRSTVSQDKTPATIPADAKGFLRDQQIRKTATGQSNQPATIQPGESRIDFIRRRREEKQQRADFAPAQKVAVTLEPGESAVAFIARRREARLAEQQQEKEAVTNQPQPMEKDNGSKTEEERSETSLLSSPATGKAGIGQSFPVPGSEGLVFTVHYSRDGYEKGKGKYRATIRKGSEAGHGVVGYGETEAEAYDQALLRFGGIDDKEKKLAAEISVSNPEWFDDKGELTLAGAKEQLALLESKRFEFEQGEIAKGRVPIFDARQEQKIRQARELVDSMENELDQQQETTDNIIKEEPSTGGSDNATLATATTEESVSDDSAGGKGQGAVSVSKPGTEGGDSKVRSSKGRSDDGGLRPTDGQDTKRNTKLRPASDGTGSAADNADRKGVGRNARKPSGVSDHRIAEGDLKRVGSWRETASRNLDIIELAKKITSDGRPATSEEQQLLSKYTGFGASEIANSLFPGYARYGSINIYQAKPEWKELVERVQTLLTPEELKTAARSTQYAHYTSEAVIRSIYKAVDQFGFPGGRILEPGSGIGHFWGLLPDSMLNTSSYTAIEMDHLTATISKLLYPNQDILTNDFTKQDLPANFFDIGIGNPPFGDITILSDPAYKRNRFKLHDYFFAKTIDKVRPGGLLVFVTSKGTMDKGDNKARKYLSDRADLLGAIRLPQTAFQKNAGTEVVTDVIFLRKRNEGETPSETQWDKLEEVDTPEGKTRVNEYFAANPKMVLGRHSLQGSMYGANEYTVLPLDGNIEDHFAEAVKLLPTDVYSTIAASQDSQRAAVVERDFNPKNKKEGGLYISDSGHLMQVSSGSGVPLAPPKPLSSAQRAWLTDYVKLRDAVKQAQYDQLNDLDWQKSLSALNKTYDAFVKKHGPVFDHTITERTTTNEDGDEITSISKRYKNKQNLSFDVESPLMSAIEKEVEGGKVEKGTFLLGRTIQKPVRQEPKTVADSMALVMDEVGYLDIGMVAEKMSMSEQEAIDALDDLIYLDHSSKKWISADDYLSGNVRKKLAEAEVAANADNQFKRNVEALIKAQPQPLEAKDIAVTLGAPWVEPQYVQGFANEVLETRTLVEYNKDANLWKVNTSGNKSKRSERYGTSSWGTNDRSPVEILDDVLNNRTMRVTRTDYQTKKTHTDQTATAAINEIAKKMRDRFSAWVWEDSTRAGVLLDEYNKRFNNLAPRKFDGTHLSLPGVSTLFKLHDHQKRAIWRAIQDGNTYLAHAVGAGKTIEMIAAGMEMRRLGLIQKPMYVVPKHMLQQFSNEFMELYPLAHIMVADEENFHTDNRRRFMAQAALNNPDAVIITHPSLVKIAVSEESVAPVRQEMIDDLRAALEDLEDDKQGNRILIKKVEKRIEQLDQMFDAMLAGNKDRALTFEEMGVDFMFVDEAHEFRKLDFSTNRQAKGIDSNGSKRSIDLYIKTKALAKKRPGRSHIFASGTPVTNTMGELYTLMRFFDNGEMDADGIGHFDAWASMFGQISQGFERNAAGNYEMVERFAKFVNVPELMKRVRSFMDILTFSDLGSKVTRPDIDGGIPEMVIARQSDEQSNYLKNVLAPRIEASKKWKPSKEQPGNPDPIINIITDGRLASIDMRFVDPSSKNDPGNKINKMIDGIISTWKDTKGLEYKDQKTKQPSKVKGATQIVFYNNGFGAGVKERRGFDARAWMMKRLKDAGIPAGEIAWIEDYPTAVRKEGLFADVRSGKVRILIGSAKKMGTGVNVQNRLHTLHYLDPPWYPSDVEQPHGRILRQGNQNEKAKLFWYATEGSYDSTMWQMVARKGKFIEQAMAGDDSVRTMDDISEVSSYELASALASGDARVVQLAGLRSDLERLSRLKSAHFDEQKSLRGKKSTAEWSIDHNKKLVAQYRAAAEKVGAYIREASGVVDGAIFDNRSELGDALANKFIKLSGDTEDSRSTVEVGKVNGFTVVIQREGSGKFSNHLMRLVITKDVQPTIEDPLSGGTGLTTKIVNQLNGLNGKADRYKSVIDDAQEELSKINKRLGAPFEYAGELASKIAEEATLEAELLAEGKSSDSSITETDNDQQSSDVKLSSVDNQDGKGIQSSQLNPYATIMRDGFTLNRGDEDVRRNLESILKKGGVTFWNLPDADYKAIPEWRDQRGGEGSNDYVVAERLANTFSKKITWATLGEEFYSNGVVISGLYPDRIFIDPRSNKPLHSIFGHELLHHIRVEQPDIYNDLYSVLENTFINEDKYRSTRNLLGKDDDFIHEEILGDIMGDSFNDPAFWEEVARQTGGSRFKVMAQKIIRWINGILDKIKGLEGLSSHQFTKDLRKAKFEMARAISRYANVQGKPVNPPVLSQIERMTKGQVQFSKTEPQTDTQAFKSWFQKSLVTKNGQPLVLFHGTKDPHFLKTKEYPWIFDQTKEHRGDSSALAGLGIFLGGETIATAHAGGMDGTVHPFYVKIERPLVIESAELEKKVAASGAHAFRKRMEELNDYDGIIISDRGHVVVFNPNQVKSALDNNGEFSAGNNDVRYSVAFETDKADVYEKITSTVPKNDMKWWERIVKTFDYTSRLDASTRKIFQYGSEDRRENKIKNEDAILDGVAMTAEGRPDPDYIAKKEKGFVKLFATLQKKFPDAYKAVNDYLLNVDRTGEAFSIKKGEGFTVTNPSGKVIASGLKSEDAARELAHADHKSKYGKNSETKIADYDIDKKDEWQVISPRKTSMVDGKPVVSGGKSISSHATEREAIIARREAEAKQMEADGMSPVVVAATMKFREMTDRAFDLMVSDLRKIIDEAKRLGLDEPSMDVIDETKRYAVLDSNGKRIPGAHFETPEDAREKLNELMKTFPRYANARIVKQSDADVKMPVTLSTAIAKMGDLRGAYFPRQRQSGAVIMVAVNEKTGQKIRKNFDLYAMGRQRVDVETGVMVDESTIKKFLADKANRYTPLGREKTKLEKAGFKVEVKRDEKVPESVFDAAQLAMSIDAMLREGGKSAIKQGDPRMQEAYNELGKMMAMNIADIYKQRGYLSSRMKRAEDYWEGFETDLLKAGTQYAKGLAAGLAKREAAQKMTMAITGRDMSWEEYKATNENAEWEEYQQHIEANRVDPVRQPVLYAETKSWMQEMLRNDEQIDRIMGTAKGLAVLKFIGFRVSSAAVNMVNMVQAVPATIAAQAGGSINGALRQVAASAGTYGQYRRGKLADGLSKDIFIEISERGWDSAQFNHDAAAVLRSKSGNAFAKFSDAAMFMFGQVEKVNRATTIHAAYMQVKKMSPSLSHEQLMQKAKQISDDSHGIYGKEASPSWTRGQYNPLKLTYTFQRFMHNYALNMGQMWEKGKYKEFSYMMLSPAILAGPGATLVTPAIAGILGMLGVGGDDPEEEFYQWAEGVFGSGSVGSRVARHGLAGAIGLNLKGSIEMGFAMPTTLMELAGAPGALITDAIESAKHAKKGEYAKAFEKAAPTAFGTMSKAVREHSEGVTTGAYSPLWYGSAPVKATTDDSVARFFGFNPSEASSIREKQWSEKRVDRKYQEERKTINDEIRRVLVQNDGSLPSGDDFNEILGKISRYNERVVGMNKPGIPLITPTTIKAAMRSTMIAPKKEILRRNGQGVNPSS